MPLSRCLVCLVLGTVLSLSNSSQAAVVVISNTTDQTISFELSHPKGEVRKEQLPAKECRTYPVGQQPEIAFTLGGAAVRFRLDPYTAYAFAPNGEEVAFQGIELLGDLPKVTDLPVQPDYTTKPHPVTVRILVDESEARTKAVWEPALKRRLAEASAIFEKQAGITLEVVGTGTWSAEQSTEDLASALRDLERKIKPAPAMLVIGYTSRPLKPEESERKGPTATFGIGRGLLTHHILIREGVPRTESERLEVLVQEIGRWLGATHSPDSQSVMRAKLGDGRAAAAKFKIQFDPLNMAAVNIWSEQLRAGKAKTYAALSDPNQVRLQILYKTLAKIYPDDTLAAGHVTAIDKAANRVAVAEPEAAAPKVIPKVVPKEMPKAEAVENAVVPPKDDPAATTEVKLSPRQTGVRKVVRAISIRAADIKRLPLSERPKNDQLTNELIRAAADTALTLEDNLRVPAFLIGIGIGLDDSTILRKNIVTRELCRAAESDEERRDRLGALGVPTVRGRRDLCQHFVVSVTLTEIVGSTLAETAGVTKELQDMMGESGFSFIDLTADLAGIAFANKLKRDAGALTKVRDDFTTEAHMPTFSGLREGLNVKRFEADFGTTADKRFLDLLEQIRKRVNDMPAYRVTP